MVTGCYILPEWKWRLVVFYEAGPEDRDEILETMARFGCRGRDMRTAEELLEGDRDNRGLTYSNYRRRASVMVIGRTRSARQFSNTYDHEKGHLVEHICEADGIAPGGEEKEYLAGEVAYQTFPDAMNFLCDKCRGHLESRRN